MSMIVLLTLVRLSDGHRRQSVYNIVGVLGNDEARRAEDQSSKGREGKVLGEGMFPSPAARGPGERSKLPSMVRREAPAT